MIRIDVLQMMSLAVVGILLGAGPALGSGQTLEQESPIEDYLRFAAENHPGLKASFERWSASTSAVAQEKGWPDPVLSYAYFIEPVQTAVGPQEHRIGLMQAIPWFGKLSARGSAAEQGALAAEQDYRAARLRLFERVAKSYYEYAYLAEAIRVTRENLALLAQQESVARARYRTQTASYSDLIKAQVEQGILEDQLRSLEDRRTSAAARLNESLGREALAPLPWPVPLVAPEWTPPDVQQVREGLVDQNPELLSLSHRLEATHQQIDVQGKEGMPDFQLGLQTILTGESELTSFSGQGTDAWIATVSLSLPLWRGQYTGSRDAARANARMLEYESLQARNELQSDAEHVLFELRDALRRADLFGNGLLPKARQALEATARAFQTGDASFLEYMDAQRTLLMFQLDEARARADYGSRVLEVARLIGTAPIDETPTETGEVSR
jgi:outer membrane protein TolC